jgi:hypothetical protein
MTQPEVGLKFARLLTEVAPSSALSKEEERLILLKKIIDYERLATFSYDYTRRRVVTTEIIVDEEGHIFLRAFQLSSEQGWLSFALADIHGLKMERNNLS